MAAIRKGQKLFKGIDYIGNFLGEPIKVGNIYRCDDKSFVLLANITNLIPGIKMSELTQTSTKSNITYTKESNISVKVGAAVDTEIAKGELELNFARKNSAFVSLKDVTVTALMLELIQIELKDLWKKKRYKTDGKHMIVNQVMEAQSGTVIFSEERNNKVVLRASSTERLTSVLKAANGNVEFVTNTKATLEIISNQPILPMFKGFFFTKKGEIEVLG